MESLNIAFIVLMLLIFYLGLGVWVFSGLLLVSVSGLALLLDMPFHRIGTIMAPLIIRSATSWELSAIPMFVWMGELMFRTDISDRLFKSLSPLVYHLPGRLLHTNVFGSALFAAVSGSSAATTATVGKITTSELMERGYSSSLAFGSLAGAGSLGLLIPPSIVLIVYGVLAEVSISRLFAAGVYPGLLIAALYSGYIMFRSVMNPSLTPAKEKPPSLRDMGMGLIGLIPIALLIFIVLGAIYSGFATPSEAGAVGVAATLVMAVVTRQMTRQIFFESLMASVRTSCMIASILLAAAFLSTSMAYLHVPQDVAKSIAMMELSPYELIFVLAIFYILLGLFLEGISITVMSLPITLPLVLASGFDPVWFGIFLVIMVELAQITPPIGFNLFIIQGLTGTPIFRVAIAAAPFFILMCVAATIITIYPEVALYLPDKLFNK